MTIEFLSGNILLYLASVFCLIFSFKRANELILTIEVWNSLRVKHEIAIVENLMYRYLTDFTVY